jgi:hypothetical protein
MSKIHILESDNNYGYKVAIHFATPAGNNSVGESWKDCGLADGSIGSTVLTVGTAPGNITQTEYDSIIAGNTIEIIRTITPGTSPTNAAVEVLADIRISEYRASTASTLKYYGHTIAGA